MFLKRTNKTFYANIREVLKNYRCATVLLDWLHSMSYILQTAKLLCV